MFRLGVPQPIECRLPEGRGGVGSERECVSDQGIVHQRILEWEPESRLAFRMEWSELPSTRVVLDLQDTFDLVARDGGVSVSRTTRATLRPGFHPLERLGLFVGIKQVHRYVFRNWDRSLRGVATEARSDANPGTAVPHGPPDHSS